MSTANMQSREKTFPAALEMERALLGGVVMAPEQIDELREHIKPPDFYLAHHAAIWSLALLMRDAGNHIDFVTFTERVWRGGNDEFYGGLAYVAGLIEATPSTANLGYYAKEIAEKARLRRLIASLQEAEALAFDEAKTSAEITAMLSDKMSDVATGKTFEDEFESYETLSDQVFDEAVRMSEDPGASRQLGPELPWASLRRFRARLTPGEVIMIGARPKVGKSCAARQIAEFAAGQGYGVVVYSLEMDGRQVNRRSMAAEARRDKAGRGDVRAVVGMTAQEIQEGRLDQREWARVASATLKIKKLPIWVATGSSYTIQELEISVRKFARRQRAVGRDFGAFVVDYFQLLNVATGKGENKAQSMAEASRRIKMLAREVKACALVVVQLNRQAADDKPRSHHARDTGALEADAAMMILLHRLEGADEAEFLIPLNRGGKGGGEFRMRFDGPSEAFIDPEDIEEL